MSNGKEELEALLNADDDDEKVTPQPELSANESFSSGPDEKFDDPVDEDSLEEDTDFTSALGWRPPKWFIPAVASLSVVLIAVTLWVWRSSLTEDLPEVAGPGDLDTIALVEDGIKDEGSAEKTVDEPDVSTKQQDETAETVTDFVNADQQVADPFADVELIKAESEIESVPQSWMTEEEFYYMLNATVSQRETALLEDDSSFQQLLFSPMEGYEPPPEPVRTPFEIITGIPAKPLDTTVVAFDTTFYRSTIDSLEIEIETLRLFLADARDSSATFQRILARLTTERDSLQQAEIRRLAKIIDTMQPAYAANMLTARSDDEVTEILFRIKPRTAAKVLEELPMTKRQRIATRVLKQ